MQSDNFGANAGGQMPNQMAQNVAPKGAESSENEIDITVWLRTMWLRRWLIMACGVIGLFLGLIVVVQMQPRYVSQASVIIEGRQQRVVDVESVLAGLDTSAMTIRSEVEILMSRRLAGKVVDALNLRYNPEFASVTGLDSGTKEEPGLMSSVKGLVKGALSGVKDLLKALKPSGPLEEQEEAEAEKLLRDRLIDNVLQRLHVEPVAMTRVIEISFTAHDPELARDVANKFAALYVVDQLEAKFEATRAANDWLGGRLKDLQQEVQRTAAAVVEYKQRNNIVQAGTNSDVLSQQVLAVNSQLIEARASYAEAEARYQQIQALINSEGGMESATEVLDSQLIQNLKQQESEIVRKRSELSTRYGTRHPEMQNINAELAEIRSKIGLEVRRIAESSANELEIARAREASLERSLASLSGRMGQQSRVGVRLQELEREAESTRTLYETFLSRFKETSEQEELQQADARVISEAALPVRPSFPSVPLFLAAGGVAGFGFGAVLALLIHFLTPGLRTAEEAMQYFRLNIAGMVPLDKSISNKKALEYVAKNPRSSVSEGVRALRTGLSLYDGDADKKTIVLTSSVPDEGKTTTSAMLARQAAASGVKVLLIDGDLRNPQMHKICKVSAAKGIAQVLAGESSFDDTVIRNVSGVENLDFLAAGASSSASIDMLLEQHRVGALLLEVQPQYDLVVIDCAPVMAVVDARVFGKFADEVLYLIHWNKTAKSTISGGLERFSPEVRERKVRGVFSLVDAKASAKYDYGMSSAYYGKLQAYYSDK